MKFSIITCTYNSEKFLKKNIESVKKQNFKDFEHIFIDGFSQGGTINIIKNYQTEFPQRVKLFQVEPKGISHAMNEGIKKSVGEYILHLHSDDSLYDREVLGDVNIFLADNVYDWIYGKIRVVEEAGVPIGPFPTRKLWQLGDTKLGKELLKFFNYIPHQGVFIKRDIFAKFGYFDESLKSSMDLDLWLKIQDKTKWIFFDRIISNYTLHKGSQSASIENVLVNKNNHAQVQNRYLHTWEKTIAPLINFFVHTNNRNLR